MSHLGFQLIENAGAATMAWARGSSLPLHKIDFVASFEPWDKGIGVFVFYGTDSDLERCTREGTNVLVEARMLKELKTASYPFEAFPQVLFEFDSHENVQKTFQGSYFYRLR